MNYQEAFNRAYQGLKAQGRTAASVSSCFYYSSMHPGITCAVGQMVPNEEDRKRLQRNHVGAVAGLWPGGAESVTLKDVMAKAGLEITDWDADKEFLAEIQWAHDSEALNGANGISKALAKLRNVAKKYNLTVPGEEA